jgi:uncharacterized OB-fold protein/acyl dehydratase
MILVTDNDFLRELRQRLGDRGRQRVARDPVNAPMVRHWCDAIGDANPIYTDEKAAAASVFGGLVAPPAMLDVWDKPGLVAPRDPASPMAAVLTLVETRGFTSVVAVNSEIEFTRYVRPGEVLASVETLGDVSEQKQTGLGTGHFVTTRNIYVNQDGDHVGDVLFRVLKFQPGTGRVTAPAEQTTASANTDPSLRPRPSINRDNQFFWDGARRHELRVQVCSNCAETFFPPKPRCSGCGSFDLGYRVSSGRGVVYAWAVPHHPPAPGFGYPLLVALIELEEGVRIVSNVVNIERQHLRIGLPVEVCWLDSHAALVDGTDDSRGPISLPQFRPVRLRRRISTAGIAEVAEGDELPLDPIPITPTLVVSAALATRDFATVHHDRDIALRAGSKDIFMNIHTTLGLTQRYLTDCFGPEALFRNIRIRLGAPNYPDDIMTMTASITRVDRATGDITVGFRGFNQLGNHAMGTADLVLPGGSQHEPFAKGLH